MSDIHYVICDKFIAELNKRKMAYIEVEEKFGFLFNKNPDRKEINTQTKQKEEECPLQPLTTVIENPSEENSNPPMYPKLKMDF